MAEYKEYKWDEVEIEEEVTEADQKSSENLSFDSPVGKFLCTIVESKLVEKSFNDYSCYAAHLKIKIDKVIEIEQPAIDDQGKLIKKNGNGEFLMKVQPVKPHEQDKYDVLFSGRFIFEDVPLYNPKEKEFFKRRRLFILKKCKVITSSVQKITNEHWGKDILMKRVLITTERNKYKDKNGVEKENVRIATDGFEYADVVTVNDDSFADI